ncbi:hypothetical protein Tcan_13931 [Toxocara canis]|nr:hypothetical protein Tcan_13931 [Toxocara canis]
MNDLHALCMYKLESFSSSDKRSQYTSSALMSLALVNTLGDDRADNKDMLFYMIYTSTGSIIFLVIVAMLSQQLETHLNALFGEPFGDILY